MWKKKLQVIIEFLRPRVTNWRYIFDLRWLLSAPFSAFSFVVLSSRGSNWGLQAAHPISSVALIQICTDSWCSSSWCSLSSSIFFLVTLLTLQADFKSGILCFHLRMTPDNHLQRNKSGKQTPFKAAHSSKKSFLSSSYHLTCLWWKHDPP